MGKIIIMTIIIIIIIFKLALEVHCIYSTLQSIH